MKHRPSVVAFDVVETLFSLDALGRRFIEGSLATSRSGEIGEPMRPIAFSLALIAVVSSCSKESASSPKSEGRAMFVRVAGMQKGEGGKT